MNSDYSGNLPQNYPSVGYHFRGKPMEDSHPEVAQYNSCPHRTKEIPNTYIKQHILISHSKLLTAVAMKKYCKENKMKGYSKLKKAELITFILKYEFD
tara:strand:- start:85 stop:378 length:294 start_codon:yes stop_codon:yes gene_type:complete